MEINEISVDAKRITITPHLPSWFPYTEDDHQYRLTSVTVHSPLGEEPAGVARNPFYRGNVNGHN